MATATETRIQGKIALWKAAPEKRFTFTGKIELTPELMAQILDAHASSSDGTVQLSLIGFKNSSDNPQAPAYSGYCQIDDRAHQVGTPQEYDEDF